LVKLSIKQNGPELRKLPFVDYARQAIGIISGMIAILLHFRTGLGKKNSFLILKQDISSLEWLNANKMIKMLLVQSR